MTKNERILLYTLGMVNFTNIMDFMIMMPLGPQLMRIFGITPQQFGLLVSSYSISAFISGVIATFLINRFDRKRFLSYVYIGFLIGTFGCGFAPTYPLLLAARFFTGFFGGVLGAIILSIVSDAVPLERRGQAMGIIMAAFSLASVFGVPFGIYIATHSSLEWHAPFLFLAIIGIPVYFFVSKYVPHQKKNIDHGMNESWDHIKQIFTTKNNLLAMALGVVIMMGHFCIIPYLSPYMVSNVGLKETDLPYIYFVGGGLTIFTSPLIGKLADKFGKLRVFTIFIFLYLIPVYLVTNMPPASITYVLFVAGIFFIFSGGRFIPSQAMVTGAVKADIRGSFMSLNSSIQQLANGAAAYFAGLIITKTAAGPIENYNIVGYFSLAMALLSLIIGWQLRTADGKRF